MLARDGIAFGDSIATPASHEVQHHDVALLPASRVFDEDRDLGREGNQIGANGFLKLVEPQPVQIESQADGVGFIAPWQSCQHVSKSALKRIKKS